MDFFNYLLHEKIIGEKQFKMAQTEAIQTGKGLEDFILENKIVSEKDLFRAKAKFLELPLIEKLPDDLPLDMLDLIPKESIDFYRLTPLRLDREKSVLEVGMVAPENIQAKQALQFLSRQKKIAIKIFLVTPSVFQAFFKKYHQSEKEVESALHDLQNEVKKKEAENISLSETTRLVEDAPVIKMVAVILRQAVEGNASDIHIEPQKQKSRVRYRFDGILYSSLELPYRIHAAVVARIKILSGLKIDETRLPQDGRFSTVVNNQRVDFRVATFPTTAGEKVVLRILKNDQGLITLEDLGLIGRNLKLTYDASEKPHGMILVTGPTGSGKSTTLYALLNLLNIEGVNIVTLEDPVEYLVEGVSQSQVNSDISYTFAKGLRQILRQDPDIIMVGEIRDEETANLAVHAALTGHLVLSTLHTNDALGAIPRLIDMGIKPFLIPAALSLVVSQRLARKLCSFCKTKEKPSGSQKTFLLNQIRAFPDDLRKIYNDKDLFVFKAVGCPKCNNKGYSGRIGVFEVLKMTETLAAVINQNLNDQDLIREAKSQRMATLEQDSVVKVLDGLTTLEEVAGIVQNL